MNYLVIGGTGFLGSYICKQLIEEENHVICIDKNTEDNVLEHLMWPDIVSSMEIIQCDITDSEDLDRIYKEYSIDAVISTAALLRDECERDIRGAIETNIIGLINIFNVSMANNIKRVVYASADTSGFFEPDHSISHLDNLYAMTKYMDEFLGEFYNTHYGMETVGIRYTLIYGMGRIRGSASWINNLTEGPALGMAADINNPNQEINCTYVKDAARIAIMAADVKRPMHSVYNASGDYVSPRRMKNYIQALLPEAQIDINSEGTFQGFRRYVPSIEEKELGYFPEYTYETGLLETINNIRMNNGLDPL